MSDEWPDDILTAAEAVVERGYNEGLIDAVCRALMAERERCAQVAENRVLIYDSPIDHGNYIAAAIRRGTPHA